MVEYLISSETLKTLADSIRSKTGTTEPIYTDEMAAKVLGIETTPETIILVDENGHEVAAVLTDEVVQLTATANDIRLGTTAVTSDGVIEGTKEIPIYHSTEGAKYVSNGSKFILRITNHEYTKLQAIICSFNTSMTDSVAAQKVILGDKVYPVQSVEEESTVTVNTETGYIDFGITNESGKPCLIRYFTFKEIY